MHIILSNPPPRYNSIAEKVERMTDNMNKPPLLDFRFEGSAIHDGRILFDDLTTFISNITLAIDRILNSIQTGLPVKRGRPFKASQLLSALEIVSVSKGSFQVALDLRREEQSFPGWDLGEQAINILMDGLNKIEVEEQELPKEYSSSVMIALRDAGRIIERGVEKISINSSSALLGIKRATYTQPVRECIVRHLQKLERAYATIEGRLLMVDAEEGKLACRVRPSAGEPTLCRFDEELAEQVTKNIRQFVRIRGEATFDSDTNRIISIQIRDMEAIDETATIGDTPIPLSTFWKGSSFEELATTQGVYPIDNWNDLSKDWPDDADFDAFLDAIRSSRD